MYSTCCKIWTRVRVSCNPMLYRFVCTYVSTYTIMYGIYGPLYKVYVHTYVYLHMYKTYIRTYVCTSYVHAYYESNTVTFIICFCFNTHIHHTALTDPTGFSHTLYTIICLHVSTYSTYIHTWRGNLAKRLYVKASRWWAEECDRKMSTRSTLLACFRASIAPSLPRANEWSSLPDDRHAFSHSHCSQHIFSAVMAKFGGLRSLAGTSGLERLLMESLTVFNLLHTTCSLA